jgi:hypothetical protein
LERMKFLHSMVILGNMYLEFLDNVTPILVSKKISAAKGKMIFKIRVQAVK